MRSAPGWVLLFVMTSLPAAAQEPDAPRIFLDGTGFISFERASQVRYEPFAGSSDANATVGGGGFAVGTFLAPRVTLRFEGAFPAGVESSVSAFPVAYSISADSFGGGIERQLLTGRTEEDVSRRSAAVLAGYHTTRRSRVQLGFLAGVAFLWERQRSAIVQTLPAIVPLVPIRIQRFDVTTTTYRPAVALGFDADVSIVRQVSVVPQLRVHAVAGSLSLRPGIAVRWLP